MKRMDVDVPESVLVKVTEDQLDAAALMDFVQDDASGSTVMFSG